MAMVNGLVREIAAWAVLERNAARLGDIWKLADDTVTFPEPINDLWRRLENIDPRLVADQSLLECDLDVLLQSLRAELHGNLWRVYEARALSERPPTLEDIGRDLGVSRERIRQLQRAAEQRVESLLSRREWTPVHWRAAHLRSALGPLAPVDVPEVKEAIARSLRGSRRDARALLRPLMLRLAGPYQEREGWLIRSDAQLPSAADLASRADEYGLVAVADVHAWLDGQGIRGAFHDEWIERSGRLRRLEGMVAFWSGTVVDKAVALLAAAGEPSDVETLVAEIGEGHNVRGVRGRFFEDERLMRVSRTEWALQEWGLEEYTGVAEEIAQRIKERGGRVELNELVRELVPLFGIKESSVRVYAEAPMFVLEDGCVRLRRDDEPFDVSSDIARCKGAYWSARESLSYLLRVDADMLRGSGRTVPVPVAGALGVRPGEHLKFDHRGGSLVITWPVTSAVGPSLGSTRALAEAVDAQRGDLLRLTFSASDSRVAATRIGPGELETSTPSEALTRLTGIEAADIDPHSALAEAIGVAREDVARVLRDRRDPAANLLPDAEVDRGLETALGELAALLDELG